MADYQHVICVDGSDFEWIIKGFAMLVQDKYLKAIPYKDFTRLKKFNKEVEFRFAPSDGAVMIVPTEPGLSLLWWGKKDDESLGSYLWEHFAEELKEMDRKIIKSNTTAEAVRYDLFGEPCYTDAAIAALSSSAADKITAVDVSGYYDSNSATTVKLATESNSSWCAIETPIETLADKVQEVEEKILKDREEIYVHIDNERYNLQNEINTKPNFTDVERMIDDVTYGLCGEIDGVQYDLRALAEKVATLEDKFVSQKSKSEVEPEKTKIVVYDINGFPHKVDATLTTQSTSSSCYPVKNYKVNIAECGINERKEKKNMDTNKMFNGFEFGPVDDRIKMSPYGMAIRNADGRYVSYDAKNGNIMDVEVFNFDNHKLIWKMPVAVSAITVGDTVIHMKKPMFVTSVTNGITVIDIFNGEVKTIVPAQNMFGFNFVTKVVSLFNFTGDNTPTAENPFGNVMPFMLMGNEDMDMKDIFMMMAVANGGNMNAMFQNPLMLYAVMNGNGDMKEMLPFLLMGQTGLFGAPVAPAQYQCNCGQHNGNQ